jgi:hypothetical protein
VAALLAAAAARVLVLLIGGLLIGVALTALLITVALVMLALALPVTLLLATLVLILIRHVVLLGAQDIARVMPTFGKCLRSEKRRSATHLRAPKEAPQRR